VLAGRRLRCERILIYVTFFVFECRAIDLSHVYVWGDGLLDLNTVKERMGFDGGNAYLPCMPREPENVIDRLPLDWSEKVLTPLMVVRIVVGHTARPFRDEGCEPVSFYTTSLQIALLPIVY